jgi:hypothetical protein
VASCLRRTRRTAGDVLDPAAEADTVIPADNQVLELYPKLLFVRMEERLCCYLDGFD